LKANKNNRFDTIATHWLSHLDEFGGASLLLNFGEALFPGVKTAKLTFLQQEPKHPVPGTIYVGIGDTRLGEFDEHRSNGPRLENTCAFSLIARRLGVSSKEGVHELLGEILWCDTRPKVFPTQLATLVKVAHRAKTTTDQFGTFLWANDAIKTLIFGRSFDESYDIRQAWKNYREDNKVPEIKDLEIFMEAAYGRRKTFVTEIAGICARMRPDLRQKWLPATFRMLVRDAELFQEAVKEIADKSEIVEVETDKGPEPMVLIASDNEQVARAASSAKTWKTSIMVIRNSAGLTAIMGNHERGIDLSGLAQMIRMAEWQARTGKKLSLEKARGEGVVQPCDQWCLANKNLLLNGSLTHPKVVPSKLSLDDIKYIASRAFMHTQREAWFLNYQRPPAKAAGLQTKVALVL
jgi:hypothetical protein